MPTTKRHATNEIAIAKMFARRNHLTAVLIIGIDHRTHRFTCCSYGTDAKRCQAAALTLDTICNQLETGQLTLDPDNDEPEHFERG